MFVLYKTKNAMKKQLFTIMLATFSLGVFAQGYKAEDVLADYIERDGVTSFSMNKTMDELLDGDLIEIDDKEMTLDGTIKKMRLTIFPEESPSSDWANGVMRDLKKKNFKILYNDSEDDSEAFILGLGRKGRYSEVVMIIFDKDDESAVIISIYGDIIVEQKK